MREYLNNNQNNEEVSNYCGECFKPIEAGLDRDARRHFSKDMLCQCGRGS
jgi:hypothetical protein